MVANPAEMNSKFASLRRFNLIMGVLHLVQGLFMILVSNDTTYPIYTNYLSFSLRGWTGISNRYALRHRSCKRDDSLYARADLKVAMRPLAAMRERSPRAGARSRGARRNGRCRGTASRPFASRNP